MRKLASIQKIESVEHIPDSDFLDVIRVLGWKVVVKRDEFKPGDICVYCEVDSLMPDKPEFDFLRDKKFRIKTVKLRGQVSQGICFPLSVLPENTDVNIGDDVSELIGVVKYEPPIPANMSGLTKGSFPSFIQKTDEERIQTCYEKVFAEEGPVWCVSEKLDGTSFTAFLNEDEYGICSRNLQLKMHDPNNPNSTKTVYERVSDFYALEEKMRNHPLLQRTATQGEILAEGIQKNKYAIQRGEVCFRVFSIFDIESHERVHPELMIKICDILGLETVPIIHRYFEIPKNVDELVEMSRGSSLLNPALKHREGIVFRHEYKDLSFKVINPDFLLKYSE